jgi:phosphate transport system permease protein
MSILAESPPLVPRRTSTVASRSGFEQAIKVFFGGNALVAVIVLALITLFLFREGFGFFGQNLENLRLYRQAGLEYVDIIRGETQKHAALTRKLSQVRLRQFHAATSSGVTPEEANAALAGFDDFASAFSDTGTDLNGLVSDTGELATALKEQLHARAELLRQRVALERQGRAAEAGQIAVPEVDRATGMTMITATTAQFEAVAPATQAAVTQAISSAPAMEAAAAQKALDQWKVAAAEFAAGLPAVTDRLRNWNADAPVPWYRAISSFLFGSDWITASFWQDWYGIRPLLVGSIMVSIVALTLAVPLGVASAVYVSEIATKHEKRLIKPYIEFIAAIPSVVLGFFGIAVVGQAVRALSQLPALSWVPFFPISERLNIFTAGLLLALMAVPTIFTLSKTRSATCRAASRKPPTRSARIACKPSRAFSSRPRSRASSRRCCSVSAASSARRWWCCSAPGIGSRSRISRRSRRDVPAGPHHDRHHRAGDGRSGARQHALSRVVHGRPGAVHDHARDQLPRAEIRRALPDEHWLI